MAELTLQDVEWFAERGHPLLVLGVDGRPTQWLTVALSVGDARALALTPSSEGIERVCLFGLVESMMSKMGGTLRAAEFGVGPTMTLDATLHIDTADGELAIQANFADAVALACRAGAPMTISDTELARASSTREPNAVPEQNAPNAVRSFIETLDLGWIDGSGPPPIREQ